MILLRKLADTDYISGRFRKKRNQFFIELLKLIPGKPISILDVGGRQSYWRDIDSLGNLYLNITIINLVKEENNFNYVEFIIGDGRNMYQFYEKQFDVVFSNSVIEHLKNYVDQRRMASEIQRVGKRYFVQTPNYYFPIEPHFFFPCFQFLPTSLKIMLLGKINLGWHNRERNQVLAKDVVLSINLLKKEELRALFPGCKLFKESILLFPKSYVAYGGWDR